MPNLLATKTNRTQWMDRSIWTMESTGKLYGSIWTDPPPPPNTLSFPRPVSLFLCTFHGKLAKGWRGELNPWRGKELGSQPLLVTLSISHSYCIENTADLALIPLAILRLIADWFPIARRKWNWETPVLQTTAKYSIKTGTGAQTLVHHLFGLSAKCKFNRGVLLAQYP